MKKKKLQYFDNRQLSTLGYEMMYCGEFEEVGEYLKSKLPDEIRSKSDFANVDVDNVDWDRLINHFQIVFLANEIHQKDDNISKWGSNWSKGLWDKEDWTQRVRKIKELTEYRLEHYPETTANKSMEHHHWYWQSYDIEFEKSIHIGDIDRTWNEPYVAEVFDKKMTNFDLWYNFAECECGSRDIEKSDGVNKLGICLDCDEENNYDPDQDYNEDLDDYLMEIEEDAEKRGVLNKATEKAPTGDSFGDIALWLKNAKLYFDGYTLSEPPKEYFEEPQ